MNRRDFLTIKPTEEAIDAANAGRDVLEGSALAQPDDEIIERSTVQLRFRVRYNPVECVEGLLKKANGSRTRVLDEFSSRRNCERRD